MKSVKLKFKNKKNSFTAEDCVIDSIFVWCYNVRIPFGAESYFIYILPNKNPDETYETIGKL